MFVYLGQSPEIPRAGPPRDPGCAPKVTGPPPSTTPRRRVTLDTVCTIAGKPVLRGEAQVLAPSARFD